jgi:hypothetical protein
VRGGLDDALDKLARRDELRRRAAGEATGTPAAVQDLVEAIAAVVARNPSLALTVGVEGAGDPVLLHVAVEDGVVQVTADNSVGARAAEATTATAPKHADFDIDLDDEPYAPQSAYTATAASVPAAAEPGEETRKLSYDDRDRYDPGTGYTTIGYGAPADPPAAPDRRDDAFFPPPAAAEPSRWYDEPARDSTSATAEQQYQPHPFAATPPPPLPPQTTRRIHAEQHRAPEEPSAAERSAAQHSAARAAEHRAAAEQPAPRGMPTPLPEPIPLRVDSEETEMAAKRLAALLRDNPSLLQQTPPD